MEYVRNTIGIAEKQAHEVASMNANVQATTQEKQAAKMDYIAMMAGIDLSDIISDEEEEGAIYAEQDVRAGEEVL